MAQTQVVQQADPADQQAGTSVAAGIDPWYQQQADINLQQQYANQLRLRAAAGEASIANPGPGYGPYNMPAPKTLGNVAANLSAQLAGQDMSQKVIKAQGMLNATRQTYLADELGKANDLLSRPPAPVDEMTSYGPGGQVIPEGVQKNDQAYAQWHQQLAQQAAKLESSIPDLPGVADAVKMMRGIAFGGDSVEKLDEHNYLRRRSGQKGGGHFITTPTFTTVGPAQSVVAAGAGGGTAPATPVYNGGSVYNPVPGTDYERNPNPPNDYRNIKTLAPASGAEVSAATTKYEALKDSIGVSATHPDIVSYKADQMGWNNLDTGSKTNTRVGDMQALVGFMQSINPQMHRIQAGSAEEALTDNMIGIYDRAKAFVDAGGRIPPDVMAAMRAHAYTQLKKHEQQANIVVSAQQSLNQLRGVDPEDTRKAMLFVPNATRPGDSQLMDEFSNMPSGKQMRNSLPSHSKQQQPATTQTPKQGGTPAAAPPAPNLKNW